MEIVENVCTNLRAIGKDDSGRNPAGKRDAPGRRSMTSESSHNNTGGLLIQHGACNRDGGVGAGGFGLEAAG